MKKKSKQKEAKFFCESCGTEVPRYSKTCPTCGKFFASVRCPQCGRMGTNDDFKNGCPTCGYAVNPEGSSKSNSGIPGIPASQNRYGKGKNGKNGLAGLFGRKKNGSSEYNDSALPFWVYAVSLLVLAVLIFCIYSCL